MEIVADISSLIWFVRRKNLPIDIFMKNRDSRNYRKRYSILLQEMQRVYQIIKML